LHFEVTEASPLGLAQSALRGERPPVRIDGAVDFASDLQWLADNLRWDIEDDMARVIGDVPAHTLASVARSAAQALRGFVRSGARGANAVAPWSGTGPLP
jgi:ubiquinone biosynthesis protein UbiJ